jgi:hypothetical protein
MSFALERDKRGIVHRFSPAEVRGRIMTEVKRVSVVRRKSAIGTGGTVTVIVRTTGPMATTPTIGPITMVGVPALAFGLVSRLTEH